MSHLDADVSVWLKKIGVLGARIPPVVPGAKLRLMFVLGALFAVLFPLVYVALIPLVAWALYWFGSASDTTRALADRLGCRSVGRLPAHPVPAKALGGAASSGFAAPLS